VSACSDDERRLPTLASYDASLPRSPALDLVPEHQAYSIEDLKLMHYYTHTAYKMFDNHSFDSTYVWRDAVVQVAFNHPFLMRALLGLSAYHLASTISLDLDPNPSTSTADAATAAAWIQRADRHHEIALQLAHPVMAQITRENCHAVFIFASMFAVTRFAMMRAIDDGKALLDNTIRTLDLWRGVLAVVEHAFEWLRDGPIGPIIAVPYGPAADPDIDPEVVGALDALDAAIRDGVCQEGGGGGGHGGAAAPALEESEAVGELREAYLAAVQKLRWHFANRNVQRATANTTSAWAVLLRPPFMAELQARRPLALVVFGYWCAALHEQRDIWWTGDRGRRLVEAVVAEVGGDEKWLRLVDVARRWVETPGDDDSKRRGGGGVDV